MKKCCFCKLIKPAADFGLNRSRASGLQDDCRPCKTLRARLTYPQYRTRRLQSACKWRNNNRDTSRAASRNWASKNKERVIKNYNKYRSENRDRIRALKKLWIKKNFAKKLSANSERRAGINKASPEWLTSKHRSAITEFYQDARELQWLSLEPLHVDHIIPLKGAEVCGLHVPWNLQILPRTANLKKSNKVTKETG